MELVQEELAEFRAQMATQMTHFMEAIANMNREQQELRALVERPCVEVEHPEFEDFSMGQQHP